MKISAQRLLASEEALLDGRLRDLRNIVDRLIERAEHAEATNRELQATLDYVVSLLVVDEATRLAAICDLFGGAPEAASPMAAPTAWRPVVVAGGLT